MRGGAPIPGRLVQVRLRSHVVEAMDAAIAESTGVYRDRSQFISDAVQDKLAADGVVGGVPLVRAPGMELRDQADDIVGTPSTLPLQWGGWRGQEVPSRQAAPSGLVCFGLHNRDLPSLFAADRLAVAVGEAGRPIPWISFARGLRADAVAAGAVLDGVDRQTRASVKLATGFPRGEDRNRGSEDRFIASSVGSNPRRPDAPLAVLGLMHTDGETVLPSTAALALLADLIDAGMPMTLMPPSPAAVHRWLQHLTEHAPGEAGVWRRLLLALVRRPARPALISSFPEWDGRTAETNIMGLVSRAREWGLVRPQMNERRYELTSLGEELLQEVA